MMMKLKKLALLALSTLALAACGGGGIGLFKIPPIVPVGPPIDAAPHIKGAVLGALFDAKAVVFGIITPSDSVFALHLQGIVVTDDTRQAYWELYGLPNAKGTYACGTSVSETSATLGISFIDFRNGAEDHYFADRTAGSSCSVTVEDVNATQVSGRFRATLVKSVEGNPSSEVTEGSFRVPLERRGT